MKDLGSFGPQPDMVFSETSAAASLTLRGWGRKRGTGSISTGHTLLPLTVLGAGPSTQTNSFSLENLTLNLIIGLL